MPRVNNGKVMSAANQSRTLRTRLVVMVTAVAVLTVIGFFILERGSRGAAVRPSRVDTSPFDGKYRLIPGESFMQSRAELAAAEKEAAEKRESDAPESARLAAKVANLRSILRTREEQYANFTIERGVIRSGATLVQEFSLNHAKTQDGKLVGVALWHEDVEDPGDCVDEPIQFALRGTRLEFIQGDEKTGFDQLVVLERLPAEGRK
jgi:hypothetical protein